MGSNLMSADECKQFVQEIEKWTYKFIGEIVCIASYSVGMPLYRFCKEIAPCWGVKPATVKRALRRGVPAKLSYEQITTAMEQAYRSHINNLKPPHGKKESMEKEMIERIHDELYPIFFESIECLYKRIEAARQGLSWIEENRPLLARATITAFMSGAIPKEEGEEGLSGEDCKWLRESLYILPPKGIKVAK